jgi:hypothetical protein
MSLIPKYLFKIITRSAVVLLLLGGLWAFSAKPLLRSEGKKYTFFG